MNLRDAILAAADHIERYPEEFDFHALGVPECGTRGCVLGWISHFMGCPPSSLGFGNITDHMDLPLETLGSGPLAIGDDGGYACRTFAFYNRMDRVAQETPFYEWAFEAQACARTLRRYADRYHPEARAA